MSASPSPAVAARLTRLAFVGEFTEDQATARGCRLIASEHGAAGAADQIRLQLLVDKTGTVRDARFISPAQGDLQAAYDAMCEVAIGLPLADAARISPRRVDDHLRGGDPTPALPLAFDADTPFYVLRKALERWQGAASAAPAVEKPFAEVGLFERVKRIESVLDMHVRPALASDGGGMDLVDLKGDELFVQYHGACGSCSSSIGGTLQFVQDSLNNHLAANLTVRVTSIEDEMPFSV